MLEPIFVTGILSPNKDRLFKDKKGMSFFSTRHFTLYHKARLLGNLPAYDLAWACSEEKDLLKVEKKLEDPEYQDKDKWETNMYEIMYLAIFLQMTQNPIEFKNVREYLSLSSENNILVEIEDKQELLELEAHKIQVIKVYNDILSAHKDTATRAEENIYSR